MLMDFIGDAGELIILAIFFVASIIWYKVSDWRKAGRKNVDKNSNS